MLTLQLCIPESENGVILDLGRRQILYETSISTLPIFSSCNKLHKEQDTMNSSYVLSGNYVKKHVSYLLVHIPFILFLKIRQKKEITDFISVKNTTLVNAA